MTDFVKHYENTSFIEHLHEVALKESDLKETTSFSLESVILKLIKSGGKKVKEVTLQMKQQLYRKYHVENIGRYTIFYFSIIPFFKLFINLSY